MTINEIMIMSKNHGFKDLDIPTDDYDYALKNSEPTLLIESKTSASLLIFSNVKDAPITKEFFAQLIPYQSENIKIWFENQQKSIGIASNGILLSGTKDFEDGTINISITRVYESLLE